MLVVAMHHLVSDRWSTAVFLAELSELYEAFAAGRPSPLPELPVQYGDFAVWQQQQLDGGGWQQDLAYWRGHLDGAPRVLDLATDRPRPAVQSFNGGSVPVELPPALPLWVGTTVFLLLPPVHHVLPSREPDLSCDLETRPDQALLFRLSGGRSPVHADPEVARAAGFRAPLLQARCTAGLACRAILKTICDYDYTLIKSFDVHFTGAVYPGETLTTDMWQERNVVSFRCTVRERDAVVLDNGKCTLVG